MVSDDIPITLGIEEEFFLIDPETRDLLADPDPRIFEECERTSGPHTVVHEALRAQIETNTKVCGSIAELRTAVEETRRLVIEAAAKFGAAVLACSMHPFARWQTQMTTPKQRYREFENSFQENMRRLLIGGMHIHAGFGDPDTRIEVMTAIRRHLPLLLAVSTSSPLNAGRTTGFKSYRLSIFGTLPRTGLPGPLSSYAEYNQLIENYRDMNFIADGSELWWDIRPSHKYPTIEMRICDVCPRIEDAISIAALYVSLLRNLLRRARDGRLEAEPLTELILENRWVAQRYGVLGFLGDLASGGRIDIQDYAEHLLEGLDEDARALGCDAEIGQILTVIREGSAADRQVDHYRLRLLEGDSEEEALRSVVDLMIAETRHGSNAAA